MVSGRLIGLVLGKSVKLFMFLSLLSGHLYPFCVSLFQCLYAFSPSPSNKSQITVPVSIKSEEVMGKCQI